MRAIRVVGAALAFAALAGCSGGDDTDATPVLDLTDSGPGTCLQVPDELPPEVSKLPVIECSEEHTHEIYGVPNFTTADDPDDDETVFPGQEALDTFAEQACVGAFQSYVGISAFDSRLRFTWLTPTLSSWNDHDDRAILCVLNEPDLAPMTGSKKDSRE